MNSDHSLQISSTALKNRCTLQRLFVADVSFEMPHPTYTLSLDTAPVLDRQLHIYQKNSAIPDTYHVELKISVQAILQQSVDNDSSKEKEVLFLVEITQGGLFTISTPLEVPLEEILYIDCPATLYPYGRELITNLTSRAELPPLYLPPVDFYKQYAEKQQ